ncbi:MAG: histidine phosphatase family protein [Anaerolineae bacterium]
MAQTTTLHLVRHGEVYNPLRQYYGRLPGFRLSENGLAQARVTAHKLGQHSNSIAAVFSSPMERTTETATEILKQLNGQTLQISELLNEVYSPFDGQPIAVLVERNWDLYSGTQPPFEQPADILGRAKAFIAQVRKEYAGGDVVAVTHGDFVAAVMLWSLGQPMTPEHKKPLYRDYIGHASVTSFTFHSESDDEVPKFRYFEPPQ